MKNRTTTLEQTISVIYKEHSAALLSVLVRLFGSHNFDLAEDVLQDAFLIRHLFIGKKPISQITPQHG